MAHVHVEDAHAEREGIDDLGILQVTVHANDALGTAVGEEAVEAVVRIVIHDVVDALEVLLLDDFLFLDIVDPQAAHLAVVVREDETLALAVQGHEGRVVKLDAVDVAEPALTAGIEVELRQVGEVARRVGRGVGLARGRVVDEGRHGAHRLRGERGGLRERELPHGGQVLRLVFFLVHFPVVPDFAERLPVHLLELVAEEGPAVGRAVVEADQLVVAVFLRQVIDEAGTVEVGVRTHLEVHRGTFRLQTHHGEERLSAVDDAAEIHLVVAAKGAAHAAAQPGLHETGNALLIPAGGIPTGHGDVAPEGRDGLRVVHGHLGAEELAPAQVALVVLVRHHDVRVLVAEELPVPLGRRVDVVRHVQRSHADLNQGTRQRRRTAVAVVLPVCEHQQRRFGLVDGIGGPDLLMQRLAVLVHAHHVGDVAREVLVEEHQGGFIRFVLVINPRLPPGKAREQ